MDAVASFPKYTYAHLHPQLSRSDILRKEKRQNVATKCTVRFLSIEIPKKVFGGFDNIFHVYLMRGFQKMEEIEFSRWLFEGRLRQGKNVLPDGLNWLCYFAGSSNSHHEN